MSGHATPFVKNAVLFAAAFMIGASSVVAGDRVHARRQTTPSPTPTAAVTTAASPPVVISVVTRTLPQPPKEPGAFVDLRGPDGQVRRFQLEGGPEVIQVRRLVLRPGDSLTIQVALAK